MGLNISNRGQVRFVRRPGGCRVTLSISYEVPDVLAPFGNVSYQGLLVCQQGYGWVVNGWLGCVGVWVPSLGWNRDCYGRPIGFPHVNFHLPGRLYRYRML
jgi:hypothetical protein